jgi:hypothetical protein
MVQVAITYETPYRDAKVLEPTMTGMCLDWARFSHSGWLLWTNRSIFEITERLKAVLQSNDQFLVSALNPHEHTGGRLPQWIWDWINVPRDPVTGLPAAPPSSTPNPFAGLAATQPWWNSLYGPDVGKKKD